MHDSPIPWHANAVFYGLEVATFRDANGDGRGDFAGLIGQLDYLVKLGVDCVWLLPFYPSPRRDNGYDVTDYCAVDPRFGTLADFDAFIRAADARGLRVLVDLVCSHTSDQHPWFQRARRDPDSPYRDYYIWSDTPVQLPGVEPIFPGVEDSIWRHDKIAGAYYLHRFYGFEPDLNTLNPRVQDEILRVMEFWLARGVAGFRVDAAPYIVRPTGDRPPSDNDPFELFRRMRELVITHRPDGVLLAEADAKPDELGRFFGNGERLNMLFNFVLDSHLFLALARHDREPIMRAFGVLPTAPPGCQWTNFVRNLDELDLERLSEEQQQEVYAAFAPEQNMRIYGRGIRRRLAPMLGGDPRRVAHALSLLYSLPGAPLIIYGDEIGMGDDLSQRERNSVRTAMQWSAAPNGGFSTAAPDQLACPTISGGPFGYPRVNVAAQEQDDASLLERVRRIVRARHACPEIGAGGWRALDAGTPSVLALRFSFGSHDASGAVIVAHNLTERPLNMQLTPGDSAGAAGIEELLADRDYPPVYADDTHMRLDGYGYRWLRIHEPRRRK